MPPPKPAALLVSPDEIEAQFYEALAHADIEKLMAAWSDDDDIVCVHPGGPRVIGPAAVRASFAAIFAKGTIPVRAEAVRRLQSADSAVHSVIERVDITTTQGLQQAHVIATNVYVKTLEGWRLVAHHASPGTSRELSDISGEAPTTLH